MNPGPIRGPRHGLIGAVAGLVFIVTTVFIVVAVIGNIG